MSAPGARFFQGLTMTPANSSTRRDALVLIHAPVGRDARLLHEVLGRAQIEAAVCRTIDVLCSEMQQGAGAVLVTEEALDTHAVECLLTVLRAQASWSDLPLIVLTMRGELTLTTRDRLRDLGRLGDLSLLERPLRSDTIVSVARAALRSRAKQYEVRGREAELQLVADNVPVLIAYVDSTQVFRRVNRTYFDWFGVSPDQIVGRSIRELAGDLHYGIAEPFIRRALAGEALNFESQVRDKDGNLREITASYAPDLGPDRRVQGFISLVQDITERKRAERRQTLLLQLGEQQRNTSHPTEIMHFTSEALGRHLQADRVGFFEVHGQMLEFKDGWTAGTLPLLKGSWPADAIGSRYLERVHAGETLGIADARESSLTSDSEFAQIGAVGLIGAPIMRNGRWSAGLYVHAVEPRSWRADEIDLVKVVAEQTWDAVERAQAIAALRSSEAQFRFLASLDDATRSLNDAKEITLTAAKFLAEHLDVNRCAYADVEEDQDTFNLTGDFNRDVPSIVGRYTFGAFGDECLRLMREGQPYVVFDSETDWRTAVVRDSYRATRIRAVICVPLLKRSRFVAALAVHQTQPRVWRTDEVELVQQVANRCWESIERTRVTRELEDREQRFRFLAESIPQIVWTTGPDGAVEYINARGASYFAVEPEHIVRSGWLAYVHPEDLEEATERWNSSLWTGKPYEILLRLQRGSDDCWRWHLVRALPLRATGGSPVQWFGTFTDVDDQKTIEAELTRTNRELEEFAYVSSHDLQEPLRMVNTYSQLLLRRIGPQASPELEQFAEYICTGTRRMEALLRDLLTFSRAGHQEFTAGTARADLHKALAQALADLDASIQETDAEITFDPLPVVVGEEGQLSHVFQNLLSNAIKYRNPAVRPLLHIGATSTAGQWTVSVADNGIGFDMRHADRIFGLFKRLHRHDEYAGTGLGLAICKRIVERHGGRIWADSQPGVGSTFYFTLPGAAGGE